MVETLSPRERSAEGVTRQRPRRGAVIAAAIGAAVLVAAVAGAVLIGSELRDRPLPTFPSLTAHPDTSLQGTVAYLARPAGAAGVGRPDCVRIIAASGQSSRQVLCLPSGDPSKAAQLGTKEATPQLVWRADGRLEITVFRVDPRTGTYSPGWQKIVDVRSGQAVDTPAGDVPSSPDLGTRPTVSPTGQRITTSSAESSGRVNVMLTDASGTRTLLSARGPGSYTYRLRAAFWAPNWQWIAADDGRILVITPGNPSVTRILVGDDGDNAIDVGTDPTLATFAVTDVNLL